MMKIFECSAMGDTMYFDCDTLDQAKARLRSLCGDMPDGMVKWREVDSLPDGEEFAP